MPYKCRDDLWNHGRFVPVFAKTQAAVRRRGGAVRARAGSRAVGAEGAAGYPPRGVSRRSREKAPADVGPPGGSKICFSLFSK